MAHIVSHRFAAIIAVLSGYATSGFAMNGLAMSGLAMNGLSVAQAQTGGGEKRILEFTKNNWVGFRDFNGRQLIYFTHLTAYRCAIAQIRYSLNSDRLDKVYILPPCDRKKPNSIPQNHLPYLSLPLGTAHEIYLQLTFKDGIKSEIVRKTP